MSWSPQDVRSNLWRFRVFTFLQNMDFTRGIFVVFLLTQGLSNSQVGILQSILFWTIFAAEIPTGIFADSTRRKVSILIGVGLLVGVFVLFPVVRTFPAYVTLFMLWGLSLAFRSGASSALLYDGLKAAGPAWLKTHIAELGRLRAMSTLCIAGSMAAAGFLYDLWPDAVFQLSAACGAAAILVMLFIKEAPRPGGTFKRSWRDITASLVFFSRSKRGRNMFWLMVGLSLVEACHTPLFIMSQSLLRDMGVPPGQMTVVLAANFLVSAVGMYYAPRLNWRSLKTPAIATVALLAAVVLVVHTSELLAMTVVALVVGNLAPNVLFVFTDHYIQENADSEIRASWGSVHSFVTALGIGLSFIVIGYAGDALGMRSAFLLFLVPLCASGFFILAHSWELIKHEALATP